jgi:hypothetical protein
MLYDKAFGYTVFCDDIRQEVDGKVSFIGSYTGKLFVPVPPPVNIAKFGLGIHYMELREAFSEDVHFKIFLPENDEDSGEAAFQFTIERSVIHAADITKEGAFFRFFSPVIIAPLHLSKFGAIKVRAHCGDEVIRMGALEVLQGPGVPHVELDVSKTEMIARRTGAP